MRDAASSSSHVKLGLTRILRRPVLKEVAMASTFLSSPSTIPFSGRSACPFLPSVSAGIPRKLVSNYYSRKSRISMSAANGEGRGVAGTTAAIALVAATVMIPEIAEAAVPGISPSLKNLLLSVVAGGVVLTVIGGAVVAVAQFDPIKRA